MTGVRGIVRPVAAADASRARAFLADRGSRVVARQGGLVDSDPLPKLALIEGDEIVGVLTYRPADDGWEVVTLHAAVSGRGIGSALLEALETIAVPAGCRRVWLITTNDNTDALRFYQRRGFRLVSIDPGAVARARATLKPSIPTVGEHGITLRDELLLERDLEG